MGPCRRVGGGEQATEPPGVEDEEGNEEDGREEGCGVEERPALNLEVAVVEKLGVLPVKRGRRGRYH